MENKAKGQMGLFTLAMVSSAFVVSTRNLPMLAETGLHVIVFAALAAIFFFIPNALVSAELATGWPEKGGIYAWSKRAFGDRLGFVAIWLQWTYMLIGVIAMLYFVGGSLAYVIPTFIPSAVGLDHSRLFLMIIMLVLVWALAILNLSGQKTSSRISTICFITGVCIPGSLIIILGIIYVLQGNPIHLNTALTHQNLLPDFKQLPTIVLLIGFMRAFTGIEASASHANIVKNPRRYYPLAILCVVLIGLTINVLGSLSVAIVVPQQQISLVSGVMTAFHVFLGKFHMEWLIPFLALMLAIGAVGGISTWMTGPVKGLLATAENGELPPLLQKTNKKDVPVVLYLIQALAITIISSLILMLPNVNIAFWFSNALAMMIYVIMISFMLSSGIALRFKEPNKERAYKIPFGKKGGMIFVAGLGLLNAIFVIFMGFLPPSQLHSGNHVVYQSSLAIGVITVLIIPFIIYACRKPSWKK